MGLFWVMKDSSFVIVPLATEIAEKARRAAAAGARDHVISVVDSAMTAPCRHCLRWAQPDERVVLFPYSAIPPGHAYSEIGPIFVHADGCQRYSATDKYPVEFQEGRSIRAYDSDYNMIDAEVADGSGPEPIIEKFLEKPETEFVHVRSASRGCYTMEVRRK